MTTQLISESGMVFGPYPVSECFHIEKSACYRQIQEGVQMAEFLLLRQQKDGPTVWVVEAKSSCPRDLKAYMEEIRTKLVNAFMLGVAACLGRHPIARAELPQAFKKLKLTSAGFRFVLVVKGVPEQHLVTLQDALADLLRPVIKTWAMSPASVMVLNEVRAQKLALVQPPAVAGQ